MGYIGWLARRYLMARQHEAFISVAAASSMLGVMVGVTALIVVLAVMTGFDEDLKSKILGTNPHIVVQSRQPMLAQSNLEAQLQQIDGVQASAPYIEAQALVRRSGFVQGVLVRGIDPQREPQVTRVAEYITEGQVDRLVGDAILVGEQLAERLGTRVGRRITLVSPVGERAEQLKVVGIFRTGMYEYDLNLVYLSVATAQDLFGLGDRVSGFGVRLDDADQARAVARQVSEQVNGTLVRTWMEHNATLFAALKLEKAAMFVILSLIVLVACFNIVSALVMMVMEKTKDIGILKTLGVTPRRVARLFVSQGLMIGVGGTAVGTAAGLGLCWVVERYPIVRLPQEIYYLDRLPVLVKTHDVALIAFAAIGISLLATLYPAWRAARLNTVDALRYE